MTTVDIDTDHYGLHDVARMEWIKLRSLRSTWITLGLTVAGAVGIATAVGVKTHDPSGDLTNNALSGVSVGLLLIGVLGVLTMTSEYTSGMIRATLSVAPSRPRLLAAKTVVYGATALAVGEIAAFIAFIVDGIALPSGIPSPSLTQPDVLRAVLLSGAGLCLMGLIGLGVGAAVRHTPLAIGVLVGGVFVIGQVIAGISSSVSGYVPVMLMADSLSVVKHPGTPSPWVGLAVLAGYAAAALGVGACMLAWRDA